MDPFANLTALSPPESRQKSAAMGTQKKAAGTSSLAATTAEGDDSTTSVSDLSSDAIGLDDSVNIQCSADPSAFTGFQTRRHGHHVATAANTSRSSKGSGDDQKRMRLALDLRSTAKRHDFRSQGVSISQLSQNTSYSQQDFTELFYGDTQEEIEQIAVARAAECRTSPPPTLLSSMESEWRKRSERNTTAVIGSDPPVQIKSSEMTVNESNTSQEIRMKHAAASTSIVTGNRLEDRTPTHGFRETILDDSLSSSPASDHHECSMDGMYLETERFFSSDEGGANDRRRDSISSFPDTQSLGDEEEDQDASDDDVEMMDKKQRETSVDEDEEPPTQPSASIVASEADSAAQASSKSTQASSPNRAALKRRETIPPHSLPTVTDSEDQSCEFMDSSCKCGEAVCRCGSPPTASAKSSSAIRNLEFSFAMPDSQESQSQAFGAKSGGDKLVVATAPLLPPSLSSAPVPTRKSEKAATKRDIPKTPSSIVKKQKKTAGDSTPTGTSSGASTPTKRKRKRAFVSPDADMKGASAPGDDTPIRRSTRGSASTPTTISTPSVRTRAKYLSPLPSNRAYVSRSRTIFKYKFEFCLTGFMKDGEVNLMELIEEHGGKIAERYQDVFHKNNIKAVVIATPVSWRKLKFIYAIACGIPVVHPEWIHACVKAGQVIPFEGYFIPSGYSITTRKFECRPVQQLSIFAGLSFGIPHDVVHASKTSTRNMGSLIAFILKTCGAKHVVDVRCHSRLLLHVPSKGFQVC